jgi:hypothetical protein
VGEDESKTVIGGKYSGGSEGTREGRNYYFTNKYCEEEKGKRNIDLFTI